MESIHTHWLRLALAGALMLGAQSADARGYGYCTDNVSRNNIFRSGSTEAQGLAIRLTPEKIALLRGSTITGVSAAFGSSRTTDGNVTLFVATAPDAEPLAEVTAPLTGAVKWLDFTFDSPYTITGDEAALYIGYRAQINSKSSMLLADATADAPSLATVYTDGEWTDLTGHGMPSIRAIIDDAPAFADLMVKPVAVEGYFKADTDYSASAQVYNFGNTDVTGFSMAVRAGDGQPSVLDVAATVHPGEAVDVALPPFRSSAEGSMQVQVSVDAAGDADLTDNTCSAQAFFYPAAMERAVLLEGFTGQECSNCPTGHATINDFLASATTTPVIEVMHHSGYQPDLYTMDADMDYTYFYGNPSTFAPAVMIDRAVVPSAGNVPVMNVGAANLRAAYAAAEARQPYVSLALQSSYDPATHALTVELSTLAHTDLPTDCNVMNVMLAQNGVVGRQVPYGDGYLHNAVHRGVLTGNSWGVELPAEACLAGGTGHWSTTVTLPDYIFSDYWASAVTGDDQRQALSTPLDPANMYLVAYVAAFDASSVAGHTVYNAVETPLGTSHVQGGFSGITDALTQPDADIRVEGRRIIAADSTGLLVYTPDGRLADAGAELAPGLYIVRAGTATRKVMIK